MPLRDGEGVLDVNWCELITTRDDGKVVYKNAFATKNRLTAANVVEIVRAGRARWKVENENNNTLLMICWIFEARNESHGFGFPFDRPHFDFYLRLQEAYPDLIELKQQMAADASLLLLAPLSKTLADKAARQHRAEDAREDQNI